MIRAAAGTLLVAIAVFAITIIALAAIPPEPRPGADAIPTTELTDAAMQPVVLASVSGNLPPRTSTPSIHLAPPLIGGRATWYGARGMIAAAGPALRGYLGKHWRGQYVAVCSPATEQCVVVHLTDWCACPRNLLDLSDDAFAQLAPLSRGRIGVEITRAVRVPDPPPTDR